MQKPFNEHLLWKGTIQRSNYPIPIRKPNMILPKINTLIGGTYDNEDIWENITKGYDVVYSKPYWERIKKIHTEYRNSSTGGLPFKRWYY